MFDIEKKHYDEDGFCVLKGFFNQQEIDTLKDNINEFIELDARKLDGRDINYVDGEINSIHSLHKGDNYFTKFAAKESVKKAAEVLLDAKAELRGAELFAKPAKIGLPSPMHQDNFYWCVKGNNALTMWVALDYCNKENGGLTYYRGSQKLGLLNHVDSHAPGSSQKVEDKYLNQLGDAAAVTPSVEPGDVLVHNSLMIHGSSANKSMKSRRGFTMQFKDANSGYDKEMEKHYESRLIEQVQTRQEGS